ncbi:MAG: hypothetical protein LBR65_00155 [Culturomica sp.]|jgi:hypothetical protein|nr:hypothetical protein [Culturomica sp.]
MASIRRLKKDIDYLAFSVIGDCFNYSIVSGKNDPKVGEIVKEMIATRNELRNRVSQGTSSKEKKAVREYYTSIFRDLLTKTDKAFTELSELVKSAE